MIKASSKLHRLFLLYINTYIYTGIRAKCFTPGENTDETGEDGRGREFFRTIGERPLCIKNLYGERIHSLPALINTLIIKQLRSGYSGINLADEINA